MALQIKDNRSPGRNDPCPCASGLKFKFCHGDESKKAVCNRVVQEVMLGLIFEERVKQGIICKHGILAENKCIDCEGVQELDSEILEN